MSPQRNLLVWCALGAMACGAPEAPKPPPPTVTVALPEQRDVTLWREFTGNTVAIEQTEIRARVKGWLLSKHFEDSADVKKGDLLFVIDPAVYEAERNRAAAALQAREAELARASINLERVEQAAKTRAVSEQDVSDRRADYQEALANVAAAKAKLKQAELDLDYTHVRSPIDGRIGRNLVDVGNLVGSGDNTLLATVVAMDPMYVYFNVDERLLIRVLKERSPSPDERRATPLYVALPGEKGFPHEGLLDYIDNTVDPETGTIRARGTLRNSERLLYPGIFVRVRVPGEKREGAVLVEEQAVGTDLGGKYVLVVGDDAVVELRHVELGQTVDGMRVVLEGLEPSERYITNGLQRARPGLPVTPTTAKDAPA